MYIYIIMEFESIFSWRKTLKIINIWPVIKFWTSEWKLLLQSCDVDRGVKSRLTFSVEGHSEVSDTSATCSREKKTKQNYQETHWYWTVLLDSCYLNLQPVKDSAGVWPSTIIPLDGWEQAERQSRGQVVTQLILHHSLLQQEEEIKMRIRRKKKSLNSL